MDRLARDIIVDRLEQDLLGPTETEEIISEKPSDRYLLGILSPENTKIEDKEDDDKIETIVKGDVEERSGDEKIPIIKTYKPSSMGLSFCLESEQKFPTIKVKISCGVYKETYLDKEGKEIALGKEKKSDRYWKREQIISEISIPLNRSRIEISDKETKIDKLEIYSKVFKEIYEKHWSVTIAIINRNKAIIDSSGEENNASTTSEEKEKMSFFQTNIEIKPINSFFVSRKKKFIQNDEDTKSASLIYREYKEYATGHTCSANWDNTTQPSVIFSSWLPNYSIKSTDPNGDEIFNKFFGKSNELLSIKYFISCSKNQLKENLNKIVEAYSSWLKLQQKFIDKFSQKEKDQSMKHLKFCEHAILRMREGIKLISTDDYCFDSFKLANETMKKQYSWTRGSVLKWRPFQIAFFLLCFASIVNPNHKDRKVLDLLWFPTGGGKTEAYLLIAAFIIFYRRIQFGKTKKYLGISIIMRYTLRTLTVQQFQRACKMIIAAEIIRKSNLSKIKNNESFSIGLWVGDKATPNSIDKAIENLNKKHVSSPIQLKDCPSCKKKLTWEPSINKDDIIIKCNNYDCEVFNMGKIPILTCDDLIYEKPPTLLIGTIDKFAQITRNDNIKKLFGLEDNLLPPDLIIQDELHLISGPLGTLTGLYEIAIDAFCSKNGTEPKIIGSTATIRMAEEQVRHLFNRKTFQFPPPVINSDNSCFSKINTQSKGRLYLGITTAGRTSKFILQAVCASLLQSINDKNFIDKNEIKDPYSTLLVYFNALRELGGSLVMMEDDVPKAMSQFAERRNEIIREISEPEELTSRKTQIEVRDLMEILEKIKFGDPSCIDVLLATNMLSVGVDIGRLGLMVVNGQPKTMSEYIQSTSRIGREHPGIVITIYNNNKNRDKSHFETFRTWHQTLYKDIEATSVTPFAPRSRDKALHAVVVALARNLYNEFKNPNIFQDEKFSSDKKISILKNEIFNIILERINNIDPFEKENTKLQYDKIVNDWINASWVKKYWDERNFKNSLLISAEMAAERKAGGKEKLEAWPTPNSMRDVEPETEYMLLQEKENY